MKKKSIMLLSVLLLFSILLNICLLFKGYDRVQIKEGRINKYQYMIDGYVPQNGYVSDAKTAVKISKAIFDDWGIKYGAYTVEYDEKIIYVT